MRASLWYRQSKSSVIKKLKYSLKNMIPCQSQGSELEARFGFGHWDTGFLYEAWCLSGAQNVFFCKYQHGHYWRVKRVQKKISSRDEKHRKEVTGERRRGKEVIGQRRRGKSRSPTEGRWRVEGREHTILEDPEVTLKQTGFKTP